MPQIKGYDHDLVIYLVQWLLPMRALNLIPKTQVFFLLFTRFLLWYQHHTFVVVMNAPPLQSRDPLKGLKGLYHDLKFRQALGELRWVVLSPVGANINLRSGSWERPDMAKSDQHEINTNWWGLAWALTAWYSWLQTGRTGTKVVC